MIINTAGFVIITGIGLIVLIWSCVTNTEQEKNCLLIMPARQLKLIDQNSGEIHNAQIFIAVMGPAATPMQTLH